MAEADALERGRRAGAPLARLDAGQYRGGRDCRVVIEAKDTPAQKLAGKTGALRYLAAAMENRVADAGVLVC